MCGKHGDVGDGEEEEYNEEEDEGHEEEGYGEEYNEEKNKYKEENKDKDRVLEGVREEESDEENLPLYQIFGLSTGGKGVVGGKKIIPLRFDI